MVLEIQNKSYEERMESMRVPSPAYRRMKGNVIEIYKYTHNIYKVPSKPFQLDNDESRRNNGYNLLKTRCVTLIRRNFFGNRVLKWWNALPSEVVQAPNLNTFKARLNKHWKEYWYIIDTRTIQLKTNSHTDLTRRQQN